MGYDFKAAFAAEGAGVQHIGVLPAEGHGRLLALLELAEGLVGFVGNKRGVGADAELAEGL